MSDSSLAARGSGAALASDSQPVVAQPVSPEQGPKATEPEDREEGQASNSQFEELMKQYEDAESDGERQEILIRFQDALATLPQEQREQWEQAFLEVQARVLRRVEEEKQQDSN